MVVRRYQDLTTWQLTEGLKLETFRLIRSSKDGWRDLRFRGQIVASARAPSKHVSEGFLRKNAGEFSRFLAYAISSIGETEGHLRDGAELGYWLEADCQEALRWAKRSSVAVMRLKHTQDRRAEEERERKRLKGRKRDQDPGNIV